MAVKKKKATKRQSTRRRSIKGKSKGFGNTPARKEHTHGSGVTFERAAIYTVGLGVMGYAGYRLFTELGKGKSGNNGMDFNTLPISSNITAFSRNSSSSNSWTEGSFPIKYGSKRNNKVVYLQQALLAKGGTSAQFIKNTGGADGIFGDGLKNALIAAGYGAYSTSVPDFIYYQITGNKPAFSLPATTVSTLLPATSYQIVNNDYFIQNRYATALVDTAIYERPNRNARIIKPIRAGEFAGMNTGKSADTTPGDATTRWSMVNVDSQNGWVFSGDIRSSNVRPLGLGGISLTAKTLFATHVRGEKGESIRVGKNTILGEEINQKQGIAKIRTIDNRTIYAPAAALEYV